jgi:hypothetical protein
VVTDWRGPVPAIAAASAPWLAFAAIVLIFILWVVTGRAIDGSPRATADA